MKGMVRCQSLTLGGAGRYTLEAQEKHGKRLDRTSQKRRVRDVPPLVHGSLDLRKLYDLHVDGVKVNASQKRPVLHFLVKMPDQVLGEDAPGPFAAIKDIDERKRLMMKQVVDFINETHGGNAVFAARVDRDEAGELLIDVFAAPIYEKITKTGKSSGMWLSPTKFGKDLAMKHVEEIDRRHPDAKQEASLTGPRAVGIALQSEFSEFFERTNGVKLERNYKSRSAPDRLEIEAYKEIQAEREKVERRAEIQARWDARRSLRLDARAEALEHERTKLASEWKAVQSSASKIIADAEAEAEQIREAGRIEVQALKDEVTVDLENAAIELDSERAELVKMRADIDRDRGTISKALDLITRAVDVIGDKLGVTWPKGLAGALMSMREIIDELSARPKKPLEEPNSGPEI